MRTGVVVASADLAADVDRWPLFAPAAVEAGFRAATAIPMRLREEVIGGLTLLHAEPVRIDEDSVALGQALADIATIGLLQQRAVRREEVVFEQLQAALHHRTVVEQAKGVHMHQAYTRLREHARVHHLRLSDVARDVATGSLDKAELLTRTAQADTAVAATPKRGT
jgi:GAF domain-containing protein